MKEHLIWDLYSSWICAGINRLIQLCRTTWKQLENYELCTYIQNHTSIRSNRKETTIKYFADPTARHPADLESLIKFENAII